VPPSVTVTNFAQLLYGSYFRIPIQCCTLQLWGLPGKYPAISNISRTGRVALM